MKSRASLLVVMMACVALCIGCANLSALKPNVSLPGHGKLVNLAFTTDQNQMSGVSKGSLKLAVGESAVLLVRGVDEKGKWFNLGTDVTVNWKGDAEVTVTPNVGATVTVKVIKPITASAFATATTVSSSGEKIEHMINVKN